MLTYSQLARLCTTARDRRVLNVYVDGTALDDVARRSWRPSLAAAIAAARKTVESATHQERAEFERAADRLVAEAQQLPDDLNGAPGWVAFLSADAVLSAGYASRAPRAAVEWRRGIGAASYLRLIAGTPDVIVAAIDTRSAELYQWNGRELVQLERLAAHAHVARAAHMGDTPRQGFHAGTKGTTLTDAAHRAMEVGRERMLRDAAQRLEALARPSGWIVLVGTHSTVADAMRYLGRAARKRATWFEGTGSAGAPPEIARAAAEGGRRLEREDATARVAELLDRAAARGRAVSGLVATRNALAAGAAREVLVTGAFLDGCPTDAEAVAMEVLTHGARLTEVRDEAAARLDAESEGIAAVLRYAARPARGSARGARAAERRA
jgi:hypothetical protein